MTSSIPARIPWTTTATARTWRARSPSRPNNGYGLTGLAYGATLMSVRVLDTSGEGDAAVIAQGVRFAVNHGAQVINMSLEFDPGVTAGDIPELISAIRYAHRRGVVVVAAAGNEGTRTIAYPARAPYVIAVGATTQHGCLADYSNNGPHLTLVAPGGGGDAGLPNDPNCHPNAAPGADIYQVTFLGPNPRKFGIPPGYDGTSMAAPHVSATAALVIASKVIGAASRARRDPQPAEGDGHRARRPGRPRALRRRARQRRRCDGSGRSRRRRGASPLRLPAPGGAEPLSPCG